MPDIPLFVPIRIGASYLSLRLFRTPSGTRTAVAFSSAARLAEVLGAEQPWTRLSEAGLRGLLQDLGVVGVVVDPTATLAAPVRQAA